MSSIGVTSKLEYETGSTWTEVTRCKQVNFPSFARSSVETTHLGITDYGQTFMPGMTDASVITAEVEFTEAMFTALAGLADDRTLIGWRVTSPDDAEVVVTCDGFVTKCDVSLSPNDEVMISLEVKMSGMPIVS